jgi:hypothetical protein
MGLCIRRLRADDPFLPFITAFPACSVHTGWEGTKMGNSECFVTSTAEKAKVG